MGKECKVSGRPFTSFRWQGQHKRWKETCVSPDVAREKNVCQACVCDLEYGVPFHVRDHVMQALGQQASCRTLEACALSVGVSPHLAQLVSTNPAVTVQQRASLSAGVATRAAGLSMRALFPCN